MCLSFYFIPTSGHTPWIPKDPNLVDQILAAKQANPQKDVSAWEAEIDRHVYALYGLSITPAEIAIVEGRGN